VSSNSWRLFLRMSLRPKKWTRNRERMTRKRVNPVEKRNIRVLRR